LEQQQPVDEVQEPGVSVMGLQRRRAAGSWQRPGGGDWVGRREDSFWVSAGGNWAARSRFSRTGQAVLKEI
jgi:hypothetical protein